MPIGALGAASWILSDTLTACSVHVDFPIERSSTMRLSAPLVAFFFALSTGPTWARDTKGSQDKGGPVQGDDDEDEEDEEEGDPDWDGPKDGRPRLEDHGMGGEDEEDDDVRPHTAAAKPTPPAKVVVSGPEKGVLVDIQDKVPLADNYPLRVLAKDVDAVVVELPILVTRRASEHTGADWWLVLEVLVDGKKVTEARDLVSAASLTDLGPTVLWWKGSVPVRQTAGAIEVKVSQVIEGAPPKPLFTRAVAYSL